MAKFGFKMPHTRITVVVLRSFNQLVVSNNPYKLLSSRSKELSAKTLAICMREWELIRAVEGVGRNLLGMRLVRTK